jgi:hypothetical protein
MVNIHKLTPGAVSLKTSDSFKVLVEEGTTSPSKRGPSVHLDSRRF